MVFLYKGTIFWYLSHRLIFQGVYVMTDLKVHKMFALEQETDKNGPGHEIRASLYAEDPTAQGPGYNALFIAWFRAKRRADGSYITSISHPARHDLGLTPHEVAKAWFSEQRARIA